MYNEAPCEQYHAIFILCSKVAYKELVRPKLEYSVPVQNPNQQTHIYRIEKVYRGLLHIGCVDSGAARAMLVRCLQILTGQNCKNDANIPH